MDGKEILRLVESLHRNKSIEPEVIFEALESALQSAATKHFGPDEEVSVQIDRDTGEVTALINDSRIEPETLGRIAAQTAKQVITQRMREAESEIIYEEYADQKGTLVTGAVQRFEGGAIIVNLERSEGVLPRSEQMPGEHYQPGERIRAMILDVRKVGGQTKIVLSRTHPDFVRRLFELEVPEVAEGIVIVRSMAREPGMRTKMAMESLEPHVDCIGACVGVRGTRVKSIIDELGGEKIDIISWHDAPEILISDALSPAEIIQMTLEEGEDSRRAIVTVPEDQLALAIGRKGQNVRLACKLTGWEIDIEPPESADEPESTAPAAEAGQVEDEEPGAAEEVPAEAAVVQGPPEAATPAVQVEDEEPGAAEEVPAEAAVAQGPPEVATPSADASPPSDEGQSQEP